MIGIVIVAHGGLAREYRAALDHVLGPQPGVADIAIAADADRAAMRAEICDAARQVDHGDGVVVVTDMFGGSPSNLALEAARGDDRAILYGANLPMLVKLAKSRRKPLSRAVADARDAGRRYLDGGALPCEEKDAS